MTPTKEQRLAGVADIGTTLFVTAFIASVIPIFPTKCSSVYSASSVHLSTLVLVTLDLASITTIVAPYARQVRRAMSFDTDARTASLYIWG